MNYKEHIIKNLRKNGPMTTAQLLDAYYSEIPEQIQKRMAKYAANGQAVTENQMQHKVQAEIGAIIRQNKTLIQTTKPENRNVHSLTPAGEKYHDEHYGESDQDYDQETDQDCDQEQIQEEEGSNRGTVYLLHSTTIPGMYKIGQTKDLEKRLKDLKKDNRYGLFAFEAIMHIQCDNYLTIERTLHKFLEDFRLAKKNKNITIEVDTELFKDCPHLETEFEMFANMLIANPRFSNTILTKK